MQWSAWRRNEQNAGSQHILALERHNHQRFALIVGFIDLALYRSLAGSPPNWEKDVCNGDSGGPLFVPRPTPAGSDVVYGIVSFVSVP